MYSIRAEARVTETSGRHLANPLGRRPRYQVAWYHLYHCYAVECDLRVGLKRLVRAT
jgi:hypothetical protein